MHSINYCLWVFSSAFVFEWLPWKTNFGFKPLTAGTSVAVACTQKSVKDCDIFMHPESPHAEYPLSILAQGRRVIISSAETPQCS